MHFILCLKKHQELVKKDTVSEMRLQGFMVHYNFGNLRKRIFLLMPVFPPLNWGEITYLIELLIRPLVMHLSSASHVQ